jgi:hypothetical protein
MSETTTTPAQPTAPPPAKAPGARAPKKYDALLTALAKAPEDPSEPDGMKLMSPAGAQLLLGWLLAQGAEVPKEAKLLIKSARDLRVQHPRVWKPLQGMNFIGFDAECRLHGLPAPGWEALQRACSSLA